MRLSTEVTGKVRSLTRLAEQTFYLTWTGYGNENGKTFQEATISFKRTFEFENVSLLDMQCEGIHLTGDIPFNHETAIADDSFRGFMGRSYHSRSSLRLATGYRFSIYREFLFLGCYFDQALFEGSGYDLDGRQYGLTGGLSAHILMIDQFGLDVYGGRDYLWQDGSSQYNFYLKAKKIW